MNEMHVSSHIHPVDMVATQPQTHLTHRLTLSILYTCFVRRRQAGQSQRRPLSDRIIQYVVMSSTKGFFFLIFFF